MLPHRSEAYEHIFHRAENKARQLFGTQNRVFISTSSGTGLQEAAVRNLAVESVLACSNGAFGDRWATVAETNGKKVTRVEAAWGQPITTELVAGALSQRTYEMLTIVHNETSTGVQNPVDEIALAAREISPNTLLCVDAVSSLGGAPMQMDDWGLDFVLTSSHKAIAVPPGLALGATSDRALRRAESVPNRGWYFDLVRLEKHRLKNSTPATSAVSLVYALDRQLDRILAEGLPARYARYQAMAARVHTWAAAHGFDLFAAEGYRSHTVTAIENLPRIDIPGLNQFLLEKDMRVANGYGPLKGKTFRIAHMGELTSDQLETLLESIQAYLQNQTR
jgi:aspartate aminotransferase-like enzyme